MPGPGEYVADETQGITCIEDLPRPKLVRRSRNYKRRPCPLCQQSAYRLRIVKRTLHDSGDSLSGRPRDLVVTYSQHRCPRCNCYFNADMDDLALPKSHYTHRVVSMAVRVVVEDGSPLYPEPIANVFGQVKHQSCQFHIISEITKDIPRGVTQARRRLKQKKTKRPRGRPSGKDAKQIAQKNQQVLRRQPDLVGKLEHNGAGSAAMRLLHLEIGVDVFIFAVEARRIVIKPSSQFFQQLLFHRYAESVNPEAKLFPWQPARHTQRMQNRYGCPHIMVLEALARTFHV